MSSIKKSVGVAMDDRERLIEENMGLVHACAKKFRGRGIEYDDMFQAGCIGLIKAVDGFDPQRGFAFSTYAVPVILGEIRRMFRDGGSVKVGRAMKEKARAVLKQSDRLAEELGREPTIGEIAQSLGMDSTQAAEALAAGMPVLSLTSDGDGEERQMDIPVDSMDEAVSDRIALQEVMRGMPERDRKLIELRYFQGLTQVKTADRLNMSQVQVSRREKEILLRMRKNLTG
ncbi:MAG: sigma-70 family RNA polymerase sigma factor [Clostridia bacterium]